MSIHRKLVYDPILSTRSYKRAERKNFGSYGILQDAYEWGYNNSQRKNPYPKGKRHDEFERGRKDAYDDIMSGRYRDPYAPYGM